LRPSPDFGADYIPGENDDGEYRILRAPPEHAQDPTLWVDFRGREYHSILSSHIRALIEEHLPVCAQILYACVLIVRNDIDRMKRGILGLLVLGIALIAFASSAMTATLVRRVSQSNLAQGRIVGGGGDGIFIKGTYAYVAEGSGTTSAFQIFNISDPSAPVLIGQSDLANGGNGVSTDDIWVKHGFAFIVEGGGTVNALQVFDVTNPAAPVLVGQANLANNAGDRLFVQGKYAYIVEGASYTNSFEIFNISNPAAPVRLSQSNLTAFDQASIYIQGNYAYIAIGGSGSQGFDIFDVSNPAAPLLKSATDLNYGVPDDGIFVSGNYAYIAEGAGMTNAFQIFDVSDPSAPVLAGQADLANAGTIDTGGGDAIWVRDGFAYIVEGAGTTRAFEIFDVSNPATPLRVSQSPLAHSGQPDDIFVSGKYAYIVEGGGTTNAFEIFDISRVRAGMR
jgi:hypothetical protein